VLGKVIGRSFCGASDDLDDFFLRREGDWLLPGVRAIGGIPFASSER